MSDEKEDVQIVECPKCGVVNRVAPNWGESLYPRCGKCHTWLLPTCMMEMAIKAALSDPYIIRAPLPFAYQHAVIMLLEGFLTPVNVGIPSEQLAIISLMYFSTLVHLHGRERFTDMCAEDAFVVLKQGMPYEVYSDTFRLAASITNPDHCIKQLSNFVVKAFSPEGIATCVRAGRDPLNFLRGTFLVAATALEAYMHVESRRYRRKNTEGKK